MRKFLSEAAEIIINTNHIGAQSVVILPNRRSEIFLKDEIKKLTDKNIWLPEFYPVDEFMQKASGIKKTDNISLFFELYNIHQKIAGNDAKAIDEFLTWAPVMLSDFNDIDNSMVDAEDIFKQLSAIKAIQQWNPDGRPLTTLQSNYLHFFNSMFDYYTDLQSVMKKDGAGYPGHISRHLANNTLSLLKEHHWNKFLIVGINALSEAEIRVFDTINQNFKTSFIWDVDDYYYQKSNKSDNTKEAGKHIKQIISQLKINEPENIGNNLSTSEKEINILGVPKNIGQTKFIGQELRQQFKSYKEQNYNQSPLLNTAIVLADEGLLSPLLNSLPILKTEDEDSIKYNVTLGYPLNNSQVEHFFTSWIDLIISKSQNKGRIYTNDLISFLNNPIVKQLLYNNNVSGEIFTKHLITNNITVINLNESPKEISSSGTIYNILSGILVSDRGDKVNIILENLKGAVFSLIEESKELNIVLKEQLQQLVKILGKLLWLISNNENIINYSAIRKIGRQLISQSNINLIGEPLHGIQIMGMLETRNLDFENIYILSTNEGILPKTNSIDSFIPIDIRREYNLPLPSDKSDIYAYHFYRLLQRAKKINLIYNSDTSKFGGGEKSRFILQIENELSKINRRISINKKIINTTLSKKEETKTENEIIKIEKNEHILQKLSDISVKGYSPSVLSSYITCSLKFYFLQILNIKTTNSLEQSVEANTFGNVVHGVLEDIYKPFEGKEIVPEVIKNNIPKIKQLLSNQFKINYNTSDLSYGKNLLVFEVANNYIKNFLKWDINNLTNWPSILQSTESKLITTIKDNGLEINFKGIIDRVDRDMFNGTIRIIDYKTGKVQRKELIVKNTEDLVTDPSYSKAFQVIYYAWLYSQQHAVNKIETGIISLRSMSQGFISLDLKEVPNIEDYFSTFTDTLVELVREIANPDTPFQQTNDITSCTWCNYKSICNRP